MYKKNSVNTEHTNLLEITSSQRNTIGKLNVDPPLKIQLWDLNIICCVDASSHSWRNHSDGCSHAAVPRQAQTCTHATTSAATAYLAAPPISMQWHLRGTICGCINILSMH